MKSLNSLYALVILALILLTVTAFSPYGWIVVTSSSGQAPTPTVSGIVAPLATPTSTSAPVSLTPEATQTRAPAPTATLTPGSQGPLPGWKTFTSKLYKYTVSYLPHWIVSIVYFQTRDSSFVLQLAYKDKKYVDIFNQILAVFKFN